MTPGPGHNSAPASFAKDQLKSKIVTVDLSPDDRNWRPDPFPGSDAAFNRGCTCPVLQPWPGALAFSTDCPVHELEAAPQ